MCEANWDLHAVTKDQFYASLQLPVQPPTFFRDAFEKKHEPHLDKDPMMAKCLSRLEITNIVATANLDVKDINLKKLAEENFFCNYHKCTFAAMGIRLSTGSAALLYAMGVMVCMGTTSTPMAMLQCTKYRQILNNIGVPCSITGFQADNYVCTIYTFALDLNECNRPEWTAVIAYDEEKFPGAIVRCKMMRLDFETDVVMELFESGKINITGSKSFDEARYVFILVYFRYLIHIKRNNSQYKRARVMDIKDEPIFGTDLILPQVDRAEDARSLYEDQGMFMRVIDEDGNHSYLDSNAKPMKIPKRYKDLPYEDLDKVLLAVGLKSDF